MAKTNTNKKEIVATAGGNLKTAELFKEYPNLNIRRVALATGLSNQMMLKYSKQPVVGEAYDPLAINFNAIDAYINARLTPEELQEINWQEYNTERTYGKAGEGNARDLSEWSVGDELTFKDDDQLYLVVYKTDTHLCLALVDTEILTSKSSQRFFQLKPTRHATAERTAIDPKSTKV